MRDELWVLVGTEDGALRFEERFGYKHSGTKRRNVSGTKYIIYFGNREDGMEQRRERRKPKGKWRSMSIGGKK